MDIALMFTKNSKYYFLFAYIRQMRHFERCLLYCSCMRATVVWQSAYCTPLRSPSSPPPLIGMIVRQWYTSKDTDNLFAEISIIVCLSVDAMRDSHWSVDERFSLVAILNFIDSNLKNKSLHLKKKDLFSKMFHFWTNERFLSCPGFLPSLFYLLFNCFSFDW